MSDLEETLMVLLCRYTPFLLGLAAFALIALAAWPRLPGLLRVLCGGLGIALLLWAIWYFILRTLFI